MSHILCGWLVAPCGLLASSNKVAGKTVNRVINSSFPPTEHKILNVGPTEPWSVREKLCLASSVMRSGDQNW